MDSAVKQRRSLPPRVDGKIHGYLKLVIDQIVWSQKSPGNVSVLACWWGESDSAQFSPTDVTAGSFSLENQTETLYAIKTNKVLFQDYIANCESLTIVVTNQESYEVVGTARVLNLLDIFTSKPFSRYFPILNKKSTRVGDIHVAIKMLQDLNFPAYQETEIPTSDFVKSKKYSSRKEKFDPFSSRSEKEMENIYNSILKNNGNCHVDLESPVKKLNSEITDNLVSKVIARAQRLRGVIMKESREDDVMFDEDSPLENETKLYEFIVGRDMNFSDECRALETLRSTSPSLSLIDFASKTIQSRKNEDFRIKKAQLKIKDDNADKIVQDYARLQEKETSPLDYVDSLRIVVESLTLSSAGYRRVKSSCLSHDERIITAVTYFVHYDTVFVNFSDNKRVLKGNKFVKISSRKQFDQAVYFNHKAVYDIPKSCLRQTMPLKFKVYHRHLNQRSPTELGIGSMYVSDCTSTRFLTTTQRVVIVNKGIKVGELQVTAELGCDGIHFGKEFVDAIMSEKENIPVLEDSFSLSKESVKYRTVTGTESKSNGKVSSPRRLDCVSTSRGSDSSEGKHLMDHRESENKILKTRDVQNSNKDKILLHGLIYIAEGKDLPDLSTYLICRAFWREDKAASRVCTNTENPFYNFHQLVPIIHGPDFLERTRDNCIVTEVYSRNSSEVDNLLGIAKLPLHQLYIAYRDPLVLPHLTLSKYPVISVDGWVNVTDPVTGTPRGQILALVAVGTADQIALLEMTRGLRDSAITPRTLRECARTALLPQDEAFVAESTRSQECQTDITLTEEMRRREAAETEDGALHTVVDQLAQAMRHCKKYHDAQTDVDGAMELVPSRSHILLSSDESSIDCPGENFQMPSAMFRSVGVGAEFDEETANAGQIVNVPLQEPSSNDQSEIEDTAEDEPSFRAVVEIERAYHLPMLNPHEDLEPSTYVRFEAAKDAVGCRTVTNVCLRSCSPIRDWKCNTRLPRDLLHNKEKRLILKVWTLRDPNTNLQLDFENDRLLGMAAIDLSVLAFGSPVLSGWFHIMDLPGEIMGQIWVSVTPLDNVSNTPVGNYIMTSLPYKALPHVTHSNVDSESRAVRATEREAEVGPSFGDESISFLSQSLKKKLTELNEITMRLQSRLHDITDAAFEEDFDFDPVDSDAENEANGEQANKSAAENNNELWLQSQKVPTIVENQLLVPIVESEKSCNQNQQRQFNNCSPRSRSDYLESNGSLVDEAYPARGSKVHINHLLDKLTCQMNSGLPRVPVQGNVMDLLDRLNVQQQDNNNINNSNNKNNNALKRTCSGATQTSGESTSSEDSTQRRVKMSAIIREELAEFEDNDEHYDDLTTHLIASNVQHMTDTENFMNPLLYSHLLPDLQLASVVESPENESIQQLDSRYAGNFDITVNEAFRRLRNLAELKGDEGNIDVAVVEKLGDDENNATESSSVSSSKATKEPEEDEVASESTTSIVSRQAPDGGNPVEETRSSNVPRQDESRTSESSS